MLEQFAKDYGFDVKMYPVTVQDMQKSIRALARCSPGTGQPG